MKNLICVLSIGMCCFVSCAQEISSNKVPSVILNAFSAEFDFAEDVEWERSGAIYHVEFEKNKRDYDVWYDETGNKVKFEEEFSIQELPTLVIEKIKSDYVAYTLDDAKRITEKGQTFFIIELDGSPSDKVVKIDALGNIMDSWNDY